MLVASRILWAAALRPYVFTSLRLQQTVSCGRSLYDRIFLATWNHLFRMVASRPNICSNGGCIFMVVASRPNVYGKFEVLDAKVGKCL